MRLHITHSCSFDLISYKQLNDKCHCVCEYSLVIQVMVDVYILDVYVKGKWSSS